MALFSEFVILSQNWSKIVARQNVDSSHVNYRVNIDFARMFIYVKYSQYLDHKGLLITSPPSAYSTFLPTIVVILYPSVVLFESGIYKGKAIYNICIGPSFTPKIA